MENKEIEQEIIRFPKPAFAATLKGGVKLDMSHHKEFCDAVNNPPDTPIYFAQDIDGQDVWDKALSGEKILAFEPEHYAKLHNQ